MTILNPFFGEFGGQYVPQLLIPVLDQLEKAYVDAMNDPEFKKELNDLLVNYVGRPTPITLCQNLTKGTKTKIYLKREDLLHGGAHKTNQVMGQALLAKRMGKTRIIAETGAGQHGVATAIACALFGFKCRIYMGATDVERQKPNVVRMRLMGAEVVPVTTGIATLKEACNEALKDWAENFETTHYMLGTAAGPHPFPTIVKNFQKIIGEEAKKKDVKIYGVEPGGCGIETGKHGAPLGHGTPGIFFGAKSYNMQDEYGQIKESHSISAGLDFPSVGPEHAYLKSIGRVDYVNVTDEEALNAFRELSRHEGIIPALESSHAVAYAIKLARANPDKEQTLLVNLSGRGDKDIFTVTKILEERGEI